MARTRTIIDCYTDEPAGLGVPPFLGVWPRYVAGSFRQKDFPSYLTIDDLRLASYKKPLKEKDLDPATGRTRIDLINHTRSQDEIRQILRATDQFTIIAGIQTPGKYLSAQPAAIHEVLQLLKPYNARYILTGPAAVSGTQQYGGADAEVAHARDFDTIRPFEYSSYDVLQPIALNGAALVKQIPQPRIVELEAGRGCTRTEGCSFCTEPRKHNLEWRPPQYIIEEAARFTQLGACAFRIGKQSCIFSYNNGNLQKLEELLSGLHALQPDVLHIDNANPGMINEGRTRLFIQYLTPGSTAAMGVESFDSNIARINNLNTSFDETYEAIKLLNRLGGERSETGCHYLLPGINILLGLPGETPETLETNFKALKRFIDEGLLIRRINIRQVVAYPGTPLADNPDLKQTHAHRSLYADWVQKVRHEIDLPLLKRLFPNGTLLHDLYVEVHEGNVSFLRQRGSYPIIVGVRKRLPLGEKYTIRVTGHMLRSLEGEVV